MYWFVIVLNILGLVSNVYMYKRTKSNVHLLWVFVSSFMLGVMYTIT